LVNSPARELDSKAKLEVYVKLHEKYFRGALRRKGVDVASLGLPRGEIRL
jgi:hypothetical protein